MPKAEVLKDVYDKLEVARLALIDASQVAVQSDDQFIRTTRRYIDAAEGLVRTIRASVMVHR